MRMRLNWTMTRAEDRATRRRDPSADSEAEIGDGMPRGVPFLSVLRAWHQAINLGGTQRVPRGQSPPAATSGIPAKCVSFVVCVWSVSRCGVIAVLCQRVRSQTFFSYDPDPDADVRSLPYPAAPLTIPS